MGGGLDRAVGKGWSVFAESLKYDNRGSFNGPESDSHHPDLQKLLLLTFVNPSEGHV